MFATAIIALSNNLIFGFAGLIGIGLVIAFHEFGHFLFCKLFNIHTPSFSIGFGPRLMSKKIGDTEFALSAIPLGGYVEIAGASEDDTTPAGYSFRHKPWYQKFIVMFGGILFNLIFAYVICFLLFMVGMPESPLLYPKNATNVISAIKENSPAAQAGLQSGDSLISLDSQSVVCTNPNEAHCSQQPNGLSIAKAIEQFQESPEKSFVLGISRNNNLFDVALKTEKRNFLGKTLGSTGIVFGMHALDSLGFFASIEEGFALTNSLLGTSVASLKHIFSTGDTSMVAGPVMIISQTMKGAQKGIKTFLLFLAYISLSLAILNLLPLPILDGGQILFYTIEAIIGRSIPDRAREYIHIACWVGFMVLVLYLSAQDLRVLLKPYLESVYAFFGWH